MAKPIERSDPRVDLVEDIASFTHDPLGHALYAYPWGEPGTALEDAPGPRGWQSAILRTVRNHLQNPTTRYVPLLIAVASGHGIGKSALISMIAGWGVDTCEDCRVVITANTEPQVRTKTMPEVSKWRKLSITRDWFDCNAMSVVSVQDGHKDSWRIDAATWSINNTEAFAGLHNKGKRIILIFDEASGIVDKVWEVAEGALTDENTEIIWIAFGNPTQATGRFRECFGRYARRWKIAQIDSRTVEGTNRAYLDEQVKTYGEDSDLVRVRVRGLFPKAASTQFISTDVVSAARVRAPEYVDSDPIIYGVDTARFGDDSSICAVRRGRDARSIPWLKWDGATSTAIAGEIAQYARRYVPDAIFVDAGGPNAGGVIDTLRTLGDWPVFEVNFGGDGREAAWSQEARIRTWNKRAEMYANMRSWLAGGCIPDDQRLEDQLTGLEYGYAQDQVSLLLEKKELFKKRLGFSPDDSDALALTFAEFVAPKVPRINRAAEEAAASGYDRYAATRA